MRSIKAFRLVLYAAIILSGIAFAPRVSATSYGVRIPMDVGDVFIYGISEKMTMVMTEVYAGAVKVQFVNGDGSAWSAEKYQLADIRPSGPFMTKAGVAVYGTREMIKPKDIDAGAVKVQFVNGDGNAWSAEKYQLADIRPSGPFMTKAGVVDVGGIMDI